MASERSYNTRREGIMKKSNALHRQSGAKCASFFEKDGVLYCYRSHRNWPPLSDKFFVYPQNSFTPDNFETVAQRVGSKSSPAPSTSVNFQTGSTVPCVDLKAKDALSPPKNPGTPLVNNEPSIPSPGKTVVASPQTTDQNATQERGTLASMPTSKMPVSSTKSPRKKRVRDSKFGLGRKSMTRSSSPGGSWFRR
ncbi:hypothetical protein LA080_006022 [Diaporthe eres]|nr:hypothetical protein LA080_006022 [Diaporthe eres]